MAIGDQMAERIKIDIGSAAPTGNNGEAVMDVRGRDLISGLPRKTQISAGEIREALQIPVSKIIEAVTQTLEKTEPELAADLVENGITMGGGSSLLRGLTTVISNATGLDVRLADDPLTCVARGTSVYLDNLEILKDTLQSDSDE
jgi:rod shape-determining protein MreB